MGKIHTHYDNLKVARDAPIEVIRAAYRSLSQKYHPDKNPGDREAERVMKILNDAYAVLSDPERRRVHDQEIEAAERPQTVEPDEPAPLPKAATPRPATKVKADRWQDARLFIRVAYANPVTWILTIVVIVGVAGTIHDHLFTPAAPEPYGRQVAADPLPAMVPSQIPSENPAPVPNLPLTAADAATEEARAEAVRVAAEAARAQQAYKRPALDPYGVPWPVSSAYLSSAPVANATGHSTLTINNGVGDVFAKLYAIAESGGSPVREFYIPAGATFALNSITPGRYEVRYEYLNDGSKEKTDPIDITERDTGDGIEFSNVSITLYPVQGGTMRTHAISDAEF